MFRNCFCNTIFNTQRVLYYYIYLYEVYNVQFVLTLCFCYLSSLFTWREKKIRNTSENNAVQCNSTNRYDLNAKTRHLINFSMMAKNIVGIIRLDCIAEKYVCTVFTRESARVESKAKGSRRTHWTNRANHTTLQSWTNLDCSVLLVKLARQVFLCFFSRKISIKNLEMATSKAWRLKRYGRLVPGSGETGATSWKVTGVYLILTTLNYAS